MGDPATYPAPWPAPAPWVQFTKRTNDPKLAWLERELTAMGVPNKRDGQSFHAPILKVPENLLHVAWDILDPIDDVADDDPRWTEAHSGA